MKNISKEFCFERIEILSARLGNDNTDRVTRVFILERARHVPTFHPTLRIVKIRLILDKAIKKNYILNYIYNFKSQVEDRPFLLPHAEYKNLQEIRTC